MYILVTEDISACNSNASVGPRKVCKLEKGT
jgi:hypothetical protein